MHIFKNLRWRTAAILEIENSEYFRNRSTDRDEILHERAHCGGKSFEKLKFDDASRRRELLQTLCAEQDDVSMTGRHSQVASSRIQSSG